jgi:predicted MFS family arabinose efflux permease
MESTAAAETEAGAVDTSDDGLRRQWALAIFAFAALVGLLLQTRGALLPSFQTTFGVGEATLGLLAPLASAASFLTVLVVGLRAGDLPLERLLPLGLAGVSLSLLAVWWVPSFALLALALVGATAAAGVVRALDRPVLSHLYPDARPRLFSLYEMSWAVGATTGPLLATGAIALGDWRLTYLVAAACFGALAVVVSRLDLPSSVGRERSVALSGLPELLSTPVVRTMVLALVLTVAVEAGVFTWLPFYATTFLDRETATLLLSVYLVAYVPGRYLASRVVDRLGPERVVLAAAVGGSVSLLALLSARTTLTAGGASFALGFCLSAVYPTVQAWATGAMPTVSGPINAVASAAATFGAVVSPALVGFAADATDITRAMWLLVVFAGGLVLLAVVTALRARTGVSDERS